jgi:hypothetical protein
MGLSSSVAMLFERLAKAKRRKRVFLFGHAEGSRTDARSFDKEAKVDLALWMELRALGNATEVARKCRRGPA